MINAFALLVIIGVSLAVQILMWTNNCTSYSLIKTSPAFRDPRKQKQEGRERLPEVIDDSTLMDVGLMI
jgi:hypothetical protein